MSLLLVGKMTDQMSNMVASLKLRRSNTTVVDDVITAMEALSIANPCSIVFDWL